LAQRGADEVNQVATRLAVGPAQVVLVEVALGLVEAPRELVFLFGAEGLLVADLPEQRVVRDLRPDGLLPVRDVGPLVDTLALGAHLDIGDCLEPLVVEAELDEIARAARRRAWPAGRATTAGPREDIGV